MDPVNGADVPVAFAAGLVSFLSPCVLPLVPGYLSVITGVRVDEIEATDWRRVLVPSLLFIASFSTVFILLGLTATALGERLRDNQDLLTNIGAVLLIVMGVLFIAATFIDRLNREWHLDALLARAGKGGPLVAGAAFSIAWTPCIGPGARRHPHPRRDPGRGRPRRLPARRLLARARGPVPGHGARLLPRDRPPST